MIEVNRAVAVGMADGPLAGLAVLAPVLASGALADYGAAARRARGPAGKGRLCENGRAAAWARAAGATGNAALRDELLRRQVGLLSAAAESPGCWRGVNGDRAA